MPTMEFFQLNQNDWNTLRGELGLSFDLTSERYPSPEKSKKSKRPLISKDYKILLMWEKLGETIGTWRVWTRTDRVPYDFISEQTDVPAIRPQIPLYDDATETQYTTTNITRNVFNLTAAQKRKVDRHGRIKNYDDLNSLILTEGKTLRRQESDGLKDYRLHHELLQPIFNPDGNTPYRVGYPFEPENFYLINWNIISPRMVDTES